jgi:arylsulfatase A
VAVVVLVMLPEYSQGRRKPNLVLFVADDLGYGDLSAFGHPTQEPGPLDRMASEGLKFTQMYAPESVCTPSRSSMLTGELSKIYI